MGKTVIPVYLHDNKIMCYDIDAEYIVEYDCDNIGKQSSCACIPIVGKSLEYIGAKGWPNIINTAAGVTLLLNIATQDTVNSVKTVVDGTSSTVRLLYIENGETKFSTVSYEAAFELFNKFELNFVPIIKGTVFGIDVANCDECVIKHAGGRSKFQYKLNKEYIDSLSESVAVENHVENVENNSTSESVVGAEQAVTESNADESKADCSNDETVKNDESTDKLTDEQFEQYIKNKVDDAKKKTTDNNFVVADISVNEADRITRIAADRENSRLDEFRSKLGKDDLPAHEFERVLTSENADTPVNITSIVDIYRYMLQNSRVGDILTLPKCLLSKLDISELLGGTLETTGFTDNSGNTERVVLACMTYGSKRNVYLAGAMTIERYSPNVSFQIMIKHGDKNSVPFEKIKRDYFEWKQSRFRCN